MPRRKLSDSDILALENLRLQAQVKQQAATIVALDTRLEVQRLLLEYETTKEQIAQRQDTRGWTLDSETWEWVKPDPPDGGGKERQPNGHDTQSEK